MKATRVKAWISGHTAPFTERDIYCLQPSWGADFGVAIDSYLWLRSWGTAQGLAFARFSLSVAGSQRPKQQLQKETGSVQTGGLLHHCPVKGIVRAL